VLSAKWLRCSVQAYPLARCQGGLEPNNNVDAVQVIYAASVVFDHVSAEVGTTGP
jgi:hypothetical protein